MTAATLAAELWRLAAMVRRLGPDRRNPEAFHVAKDEAATRLARLAREIERKPPEIIYRGGQSKDFSHAAWW